MTVRIAIIGDLNLDYPSHRELEAARGLLGPDVESLWFPTDAPMDALAQCDGLWLAPGSPYADDQAVLAAVRWARENGIAFLASCGGMQYAVMEFARDVVGIPATHAETDGERPDNAVVPLACSLRAQERTITPVPGTPFASLTYGQPFTGMHYCSYAPSPALVSELAGWGWVVEATAPDAGVEVLTLTSHPFFVTTLFQPQIGASQGVMHPIVHAFVTQARAHAARREGVEAAAALRDELDRVDAVPRPYFSQMRGATWRWWRPLIALPIGVLLYAFVAGLVTLPFALTGVIDLSGTDFEVSTWGNLFLNLSIAVMIPTTFVGLWAGFGHRWRRVLSVAGRLRWGYLLRSMALITPLWLVYLAVSWVAFDQEVMGRPQDWIGLLIVTIVTTPLQSAAEEIAIRGGLAQTVGSWFANPVVAAMVAAAISTAVFVALHGSADPWIVIDLASLAVAASYLAWRTGGLEAAIAMHVVNNLLISFSGIAFGGLEQSYVDSEVTGDPRAALISVIVMTIAVVLLTWLAKRDGLAPAKRFAPAVG